MIVSDTTTVTFTVSLPIASYLALKQFADAIQVPVAHAAALTIFAGQHAQKIAELVITDLNFQKGGESNAI